MLDLIRVRQKSCCARIKHTFSMDCSRSKTRRCWRNGVLQNRAGPGDRNSILSAPCRSHALNNQRAHGFACVQVTCAHACVLLNSAVALEQLRIIAIGNACGWGPLRLLPTRMQAWRNFLFRVEWLVWRLCPLLIDSCDRRCACLLTAMW